MKKIFVFSVALMLIFATGVFVSSAGDVSPTVSQVVKAVAGEEIEKETAAFVEDFVEKRGIQPQEITGVSQVDFDALPKEVNIENVDNTNLAIYEVDYSDGGKEKQIFVVSYSVEELKAQGDLIVAHDKRQSLDFGHSGAMTSSGFLDTSAGVKTSLEKGYVMSRKGSITAVSTNLEILNTKEGSLEIVVYLNGEQVRFGNTLDTSTLGVQKDYDVQAKDTVTFEPGDVISAFVKGDSGVVWNDVITTVEITTIN